MLFIILKLRSWLQYSHMKLNAVFFQEVAPVNST